MRLLRCAVVTAACWAAVSCSDAPSSHPVLEGVAPWQATLEQTRPDAESPNVDVTLSNNTSRRVVVRGVRMSWPGYPEGDWQPADRRSEERRVGKECRSRWSPE